MADLVVIFVAALLFLTATALLWGFEQRTKARKASTRTVHHHHYPAPVTWNVGDQNLSEREPTVKVELIGATLTSPLRVEGADSVILQGNHFVCPAPPKDRENAS